eukprot:60610-Rhodomonas_salina.1
MQACYARAMRCPATAQAFRVPQTTATSATGYHSLRLSTIRQTVCCSGTNCATTWYHYVRL